MTDRAQLARCPRCKAHGLVAERQGIRVALDIAPVDAVGYGKAIAVGPINLYWVENAPGRGPRVVSRYGGAPRPTWGPGGSQTGAQRLHAEHSCGAPARDMVIIPVTTGKGSAPATPGGRSGGSHQPDAPGVAVQGRDSRSPAPYATPPLSSDLGAVRCHDCNKLVDQAKPHIGIHYGRWMWAVHEEC